MKIAVIGAAGSVGAPVAFYLAAQKLADEILMIGGRKQNVLKQHAMDISTAVSGRDVKVYAGDYSDLSGCDIVINTAGVPQGLIKDRMELLPSNIPLIRTINDHIKQHCPKAIVILATNPVDPLNYATYLCGGFDRKQLIGYSINDSFRYREMLAESYGVKVSQVGGIAMGEHGSTQVLLFSTATIDGKPVKVEDDTKQAIYNKIPLILKTYEEFKAGRTAGWTCAIGMEIIVRAIVEDSGAVIPCSVMLDGEYGLKDLSVSVPASLGRDGVKKVLEYELAPDEQKKLDHSVATLQNAAKIVRNAFA